MTHYLKTTTSEQETLILPIVTVVWKEKLQNIFFYTVAFTVNPEMTFLIKYYSLLKFQEVQKYPDYREFTTFSIVWPDQHGQNTDIKELLFQFLAGTAREL